MRGRDLRYGPPCVRPGSLHSLIDFDVVPNETV